MFGPPEVEGDQHLDIGGIYRDVESGRSVIACRQAGVRRQASGRARRLLGGRGGQHLAGATLANGIPSSRQHSGPMEVASDHDCQCFPN